MSDLLSQEDIIAITDRKRAKDQIKVLRDNGIQPFISADGKPSVTWDMVSRLSQSRLQVGNNDGFNIDGLR